MIDSLDWEGLQALVERKLADANASVKTGLKLGEFTNGYNAGREMAFIEMHQVIKEVSKGKARIRVEEGDIAIYRSTDTGIVVDIMKAVRSGNNGLDS